MYIIEVTDEFFEWLAELQEKRRNQVADRITRIQESGHFGDYKCISEGIFELRWKNGTRVYYVLYEENGEIVLLLTGGNKNGQSKDISRAEKIADKYLE